MNISEEKMPVFLDCLALGCHALPAPTTHLDCVFNWGDPRDL